MLHHIAWFCGAPISLHDTDGLVSPDTVVAERCLMPARGLEKLGVPCSVFGNLEGAAQSLVGNHLQKLGVDIVVIGKISYASRLQLARTAKHLGCYVIADFSADTELPTSVLDLQTVTDLMVANNEFVAKELAARGAINPAIIGSCDSQDLTGSSATNIARIWLEWFKMLKSKPPACANTNVPEENRA